MYDRIHGEALQAPITPLELGQEFLSAANETTATTATGLNRVQLLSETPSLVNPKETHSEMLEDAPVPKGESSFMLEASQDHQRSISKDGMVGT